MKSLKLIILILVAMILLVNVALVNGNDEAERPNFKKMKIKQLRALLKERGVECKGCSEKSHLVAKVEESYDLPVLESAAKPKAADAKVKTGPNSGDKPDLSDQEIQDLLNKMKNKNKKEEELLNKLRAQGMNIGPNVKVTNGDDLDEILKNYKKDDEKEGDTKTDEAKTDEANSDETKADTAESASSEENAGDTDEASKAEESTDESKSESTKNGDDASSEEKSKKDEKPKAPPPPTKTPEEIEAEKQYQKDLAAARKYYSKNKEMKAAFATFDAYYDELKKQ